MITLTSNMSGNFSLKNANEEEITGASSRDYDGYTPFDLICSSLSVCMAIGIDSVIKRDSLDIKEYSIEVTPRKAEDSPSRIEHFSVAVQFADEVEEKTKKKLITIAKRACTIGNTIEQGAKVEIVSQ
ncbi:OsmC family protein [Radiobacillus kanasensis]|uniref:OsmC family protein n=1 Tax=Radiobacillus kanasensis TaxID=2844358 RepID=UPI001E38DAED|nr:OsmC family protein [Radiobacillus kanasensis]UFT99125.1 OsmC family protein [Radiobacillus kanasensis]